MTARPISPSARPKQVTNGTRKNPIGGPVDQSDWTASSTVDS